MPWTQIAQRLIEEGVPSGTKSTVVTVLAWLAFALGVCILGSVQVGANSWVQIYFAALDAIDFVTFIGLYIYFALTNQDALRSESFYIHKLAIEHHLLGDSESGLTERPNTVDGPLLIGNAAQSESDE
jgi:hypothetical protein